MSQIHVVYLYKAAVELAEKFDFTIGNMFGEFVLRAVDQRICVRNKDIQGIMDYLLGYADGVKHYEVTP